jgi:hypothetical protein
LVALQSIVTIEAVLAVSSVPPVSAISARGACGTARHVAHDLPDLCCSHASLRRHFCYLMLAYVVVMYLCLVLVQNPLALEELLVGRAVQKLYICAVGQFDPFPIL